MRTRFWISNLSAQVTSLIISWALVTYVFDGATPYIKPDFQNSIVQAPFKLGLLADSAAARGKATLGLIPRFDNIADQNNQKNSGSSGFIFPTQEPEAPDNRPNIPIGNREQINPTSIPTSYPTQSIPDYEKTPEPTDVFEIPWPKDPIFPTEAPVTKPPVYPTTPSYPTSIPTQARINPTAIPNMNASEFEKEIIRLINVKRSNMGLRSLSADNALSQAAREWSSTVNSTKKCGHESGGISKTVERAKKYGYRGSVYGETVGCLHTSANAAVEDWFKSPAHKEILTHSGSNKIGAGTSGVYHTVIVGY